MPNLRFYWISSFLKDACGSFNFRKIWAIALRLHTNIIYRSRTFGIEFGQNRFKHSKFLRFGFFRKFSLSCVTCENFELLSLKFVYECTHTKLYSILNLMRIGRGLWILDEFELTFFLSWHQILKMSMYPLRVSLCGSQSQATHFLKERKL